MSLKSIFLSFKFIFCSVRPPVIEIVYILKRLPSLLLFFLWDLSDHFTADTPGDLPLTCYFSSQSNRSWFSAFDLDACADCTVSAFAAAVAATACAMHQFWAQTIEESHPLFSFFKLSAKFSGQIHLLKFLVQLHPYSFNCIRTYTPHIKQWNQDTSKSTLPVPLLFKATVFQVIQFVINHHPSNSKRTETIWNHAKAL